MTIIVFTHMLEGHHLEYIHHVYQMAYGDKGNRYVFLLPISFVNIKEKFEWKKAEHITFDLFEEDLKQEKRSKPIRESFYWSRFVAKVAKKYKADYVFANMVILFVPFAPIFMCKPTKIVGVIYRIYLHDIMDRSGMSVLQDKLKFWIMAHTRVFHRMLVLNDSTSADRLNVLYKTNKYVPISDPYVPIEIEKPEDVRSEYGISHDKTLFVHFGAMNGNKATIEILRSLLALPDEERRKYAFFFAGRVSDGIRDRFYALLAEVRDKVQVVVKDEFCSYEFFASLCLSCNAILTPYKRTAQSSGLIGYASQFGKPVIAVNRGLLGQLVREYELGILIDDNAPDSLVAGYRRIADGDFKQPTKRYCEQNCIENFQEAIFEQLI